MRWKQLLGAPVRPFVRALVDRVDARLSPRLAELAGSVGSLGAGLDSLSRSTAGGLAHLAARSENLGNRLEFIRKELLFELRYGRRPGEGGAEVVEPRVLNPAKLTSMGGAVRINLGAGHVAKPEYLNVDARELEGIDVVADVRNLPFEKGSLAEIYSAHLLEHFPLEELRSVLLPYWVSLLAEGGQFVAVVPDMETMIAEYAAGRLTFEELREVTYGTQEYEGDFHFNGFSKASLCELLEAAGLSDTRVQASARRNGLCYEMEVVGVRVSTASASN
jgi:hypothetical protein